MYFFWKEPHNGLSKFIHKLLPKINKPFSTLDGVADDAAGLKGIPWGLAATVERDSSKKSPLPELSWTRLGSKAGKGWGTWCEYDSAKRGIRSPPPRGCSGRSPPTSPSPPGARKGKMVADDDVDVAIKNWTVFCFANVGFHAKSDLERRFFRDVFFATLFRTFLRRFLKMKTRFFRERRQVKYDEERFCVFLKSIAINDL